MKPKWIIYGAYGYTGRLIVETAVEHGLAPIVAGRNREKVTAMATEYGLEGRTFDATDRAATEAALRNTVLVLNCAGPFEETGRLLAGATLEAGCHYLDITGEVQVFEDIRSLDRRAREAGTMLMPGVGFDVVPTDCVAAELARSMPDAIELELAFIGPNKAAGGSVKTALRALPQGGMIREAGRLQRIPLFSRRRKIRLGERDHTVYAIPWGDLSTAYYSTRIPNITVYTGFPRAQVFALKLFRPLLQALRMPVLLRLAEKIVDLVVPPPGDDYLETGTFFVWGEVRNGSGARRNVILRTRDTYSLTRSSAVHIVTQVLGGRFEAGYQTPAMVFGPGLVDAVKGIERLGKGV